MVTMLIRQAAERDLEVLLRCQQNIVAAERPFDGAP
jgi:hypothetical protein